MGHFHKVYLQQIIFKCKPSSVREEIKQKYTVEHIPWSRLKTRRENILDLVEKSVKSPMAHIPYLGSVCVANVHWVFQLFVHYSAHICQTTRVHIQLSKRLSIWLHAYNLGKTLGQCRYFSWHAQVAQRRAHRENCHGLSQAVIPWIRWLRPACWEGKMKQDSLEGAGTSQPGSELSGLKPLLWSAGWLHTALQLTSQFRKKVKKWLAWTQHTHSSAGLFSKSTR